jgi:4'-phosphopantetheinyl transferase
MPAVQFPNAPHRSRSLPRATQTAPVLTGRSGKELVVHPSDVEVYVWTIDLSRHSASVASLCPLLGSEERSRADRFHRASDRDRYVTAHAALRTILAHYVASDPARLRFEATHSGKPAIYREAGWPDLRFNLSHSGDLAVCAVAFGREVGIDIEHIEPRRADMSIAARFFSDDEAAALRGLSEGDRPRGFLNCWTRKEAYVKGRGEGLSIPLADFDVSLAPGEPAALLRSHIDPADVGRWSLRDLAVGGDYVAALAIASPGAVCRVVYRTYPSDLEA